MYEAVSLPFHEGLIRGVVRTPEGAGSYPTVIFFHGFTVDRTGLMRLHELFARQCVESGFACVRFDFYGCGESDGDFHEMLLSDEVTQAQQIYDWTCQQPWAQADKVFLSGHSLGAVVASIAAVQVQCPAIVLWSPAANIYYGACQRARTMMGPTPRGYDINGLELNQAFLDETRRMNLLDMARGYAGPVLLIHGEEDEQVPVDVVPQYGDVYGDSIQTVIIPGANHQYTHLPWKQEVYDRSVAFLRAQLHIL